MGIECISLDLVQLVWEWKEGSRPVLVESSSRSCQLLVRLLLGPCGGHPWVRKAPPRLLFGRGNVISVGLLSRLASVARALAWSAGVRRGKYLPEQPPPNG